MPKLFSLPKLPFKPKALKGVISEETLFFHHNKHHKTYIEKTNELLTSAKKNLQALSVEELVKKSDGKLFNNASQMYNHAFLWHSLCSAKDSKSGFSEIKKTFLNSFESFNAAKQDFIEKGEAHFGSGWLWLLKKPGKENHLEWKAFHDAETPLNTSSIPLLACDLWEHGYYLDYQNNRKEYLTKVFSVLNWSFAAMVLGQEKAPSFDTVLRKIEKTTEGISYFTPEMRTN